MADVSYTAGNVVASAGAVTDEGTAGETITAGMTLYVNSTGNGRLLKAINTPANAANVVGHALHGASNGQPLRFIKSGSLTLGGGLTKGASYYASPTAGGISDSTGVASTRFRTFLGIATSSTVLKVWTLASGVTST